MFKGKDCSLNHDTAPFRNFSIVGILSSGLPSTIPHVPIIPIMPFAGSGPCLFSLLQYGGALGPPDSPTLMFSEKAGELQAALQCGFV